MRLIVERRDFPSFLAQVAQNCGKWNVATGIEKHGSRYDFDLAHVDRHSVCDLNTAVEELLGVNIPINRVLLLGTVDQYYGVVLNAQLAKIGLSAA